MIECNVFCDDCNKELNYCDLDDFDSIDDVELYDSGEKKLPQIVYVDADFNSGLRSWKEIESVKMLCVDCYNKGLETHVSVVDLSHIETEYVVKSFVLVLSSKVHRLISLPEYFRLKRTFPLKDVEKIIDRRLQIWERSEIILGDKLELSLYPLFIDGTEVNPLSKEILCIMSENAQKRKEEKRAECLTAE